MTGSGVLRKPASARRRGAVLALRVTALLLAGVWIRALASGPAALVDGSPVTGPRFRASGVVHVHTNLSDGRGSPAEVVEAGRRAGADFIVVTDHNRVDQAIFSQLSRKPGDPLVILGAEISTEAGHVLAIGLRPPSFRFSGTLREVLDDVRHLGGCAFVAHPTSPRGETSFTREDAPGDWGVEVVNGDTAWREASPLTLALAAGVYPVNPPFALTRTLGTFDKERALWDRVLAKRFVPAVGGVDAHGRIPITKTASLPVPSYAALFGLVRTVVHLDEPLSQNPAQARRAITSALCEGRSVIAIPSLADPRGFSFVARTASGESFGSGSTVTFAPGLTLVVGGSLPRATTLRVLEAGREVASGETSLVFPVERPGVYRVEAYTRGARTPWILSNPISILTSGSAAERLQAARPMALSNLEGSTVIDRFEATTRFAPEHDPGSRIDQPILDPAGGRGKGAAALLSFNLNPTPKPPVWVALVDRTSRDLSAQQGVSFWMKADGEYRVWFQIRDLNPASPDEGTEAWFASVRTSPAWTLHNIPFASLRSINPRSDGVFDSARIAHMVFVIDHGAMPFGSRGRIWIDDLMAY